MILTTKMRQHLAPLTRCEVLYKKVGEEQQKGNFGRAYAMAREAENLGCEWAQGIDWELPAKDPDALGERTE